MFYTRDHLLSIRELTDSTGAIRARYEYDPFGRRTKVSGDLDGDFGYTGYYFHAPSATHLALHRAYDANIGRWMSEDPARADTRASLYAYVLDNPIRYTDPYGLAAAGGTCSGPCCPCELKNNMDKVCQENEHNAQLPPQIRDCIAKKCKEKSWTITCSSEDDCRKSNEGRREPMGFNSGKGDIHICKPATTSNCPNEIPNTILHEMMHDCWPNSREDQDTQHMLINPTVNQMYFCPGTY